MTLSYSSPMGRYYEHARLIAEATTPSDANVQLLATDESSLEHDIIDSGWGDAQGYKIGGKDVSQDTNNKREVTLITCTTDFKKRIIVQAILQQIIQKFIVMIQM